MKALHEPITRRTIARWLLAVVSLAITLAVGELMFRLPPVVRATGGGTPGREAWGREHYVRAWAHNSAGLRSRHVDALKRPGVMRIVVLGDSFTWGDKIARIWETWPYVMESTLNEPHERVEVISLAMRGHTTVNEEETLRRIGWRFEPDVVVVQFALNDPLPSDSGYVHLGSDWLFRTWKLSPIGHRWLDRRSYMYSYLNQRFTTMQIGFRYAEGYALLYDDDMRPWREAQDAMRKMGDAAKQRGVPIVAFVMPWLDTPGFDEQTYRYPQVHTKVIQTFRDAGIPCRDLRETFAAEGKPGRHWWALPNDMHPNEAAHAIIGNAVASYLDEQGLVKK